jgi:transmembrane sensor
MADDRQSRREAVRDAAARWVVRLSDPACTPEDREAFEAWRAADFAHDAAYEREAAAAEQLDRLRALRPGLAPPDPDLLAPKQPRPSLPRWAAIAASLIAVAGLSISVAAGAFSSPAYATAVGERRVVVLDDGSRVELNTDSKIVVRYRRGVREVELVKGEALFDPAVGKRPFVVRAEGARLQVGGAEVAVRLKAQGAAITVRDGAVQLEPAVPGAKVAALGAGTEAFVGPAGANVHRVSDEQIARTLAWRSGAIALNGESLSQAAAEFNRYNAAQVVVSDDAIASLRLAGYFQTSDRDGFVRAVTQTFPVKAAKAADGTIYLSRGG